MCFCFNDLIWFASRSRGNDRRIPPPRRAFGRGTPLTADVGTGTATPSVGFVPSLMDLSPVASPDLIRRLSLPSFVSGTIPFANQEAFSPILEVDPTEMPPPVIPCPSVDPVYPLSDIAFADALPSELSSFEREPRCKIRLVV